MALGLVMRNAMLAALVFVVAACGSYQFPGGPPSGTGTVLGHVVALPCTPVESTTKPCGGRPVAGLELDYVKGDATAKAVTGSDGQYSVQLSAGTWAVHLKTYMRIITGPVEVKVTEASVVNANYLLDSGIRLPVPQQ